MARKLGLWFPRTFGDRNFNSGPFMPPADPKPETAALTAELRRRREELAAQQGAAEAARTAAAAAAEERLSAEQRAIKEAEERALWESLAAEAGREQARLAQELLKLQATTAPPDAAAAATIVEHATEAAEALD